MYQQDFGSQAAERNAAGGRDRGSNVIGDKPGKSPGDTSDLPPAGEKLLKMEDDADSRVDKVRRTVFREVGDTTDALKEEVATVRNLMERPAPTGHLEVAVNAGPAIGPEVPQHASVDAGSVTELSMVLAVIGIQLGRWVHHKMKR